MITNYVIKNPAKNPVKLAKIAANWLKKVQVLLRSVSPEITLQPKNGAGKYKEQEDRIKGEEWRYC